jgi:hypothetical protein
MPCEEKSQNLIGDGMHLHSRRKDASIQCIPEQIVGIGEDFHSLVDDRKVNTTLYHAEKSLLERI